MWICDWYDDLFWPDGWPSPAQEPASHPHRFWTELYAPTSDGAEELLSRRKILGEKEKDEEPAERRKAKKTKKKGKKTERVEATENYERIR